MRPPLPARTRSAFLWIALIPILLTAVALWLGRQFQDEVAWITHTYDVRTTTREIVLQVWNADRDLRNYLLTGEQRYQQALQTTSAQVRQRLQQLRGLAVDNPVQQRNLARFGPLVESKLADQRNTLDRIRAGGFRDALTPSEVDRSQRLLEQIRDVSVDLMAEEERLLLARTSTERRIYLWAEVIFAVSILLTLALLLWAARRLRDHAARRDEAEQALQQKVREIETLNRDLERRVGERTAELQKSNEHLARSSEARRLLASLVQSSDDAIIAKSIDGVIQSWNVGAQRLYGYRADEIVGHNMLELVPPDRAAEEIQIRERIRAGEPMEHIETVRLRKDGVPVEVSLTVSPIRDDSGRIVGASHISRDITEQKRTAEAMRQTQKLESLGVLAGGIAHDFNNLLVGILGNASLALDRLPPDQSARNSIQDVVTAAERAAALTRQMLAYSGRGHFIIDRIDLSKYIRETAPLIEAAIPRTIELRLDLSEDLPVIEADATQMQQLVMNLAINGAEAIPEGRTGSVTLTTRRYYLSDAEIRGQTSPAPSELQPGEYVLLEVRDTGVGMDMATKDRIFDPFFTTKFTGRGLGLAAVLGIVRGHHASIRVTSMPGQGTTFRVLFPAREAPIVHPAPAPNPALQVSGSGTVLVIDDEPVVRKLGKQVLEHYGYRVLLAEDGQHGLDLFRSHRAAICCVVLDLTMPVMSGEDALPRLKELDPEIPVILSSGFTEAEAVRRFEGKGLAGFIQKPYRAATLAEKVSQIIAAAKPSAARTRA